VFSSDQSFSGETGRHSSKATPALLHKKQPALPDGQTSIILTQFCVAYDKILPFFSRAAGFVLQIFRTQVRHV